MPNSAMRSASPSSQRFRSLKIQIERFIQPIEFHAEGRILRWGKSQIAGLAGPFQLEGLGLGGFRTKSSDRRFDGVRSAFDNFGIAVRDGSSELGDQIAFLLKVTINHCGENLLAATDVGHGGLHIENRVRSSGSGNRGVFRRGGRVRLRIQFNRNG